MKKALKEELDNLVTSINNSIDRCKPTFKLGSRYEYIYLDFVDSRSDALFNNANGDRAFLDELRAFRKGLQFKD
jgi:hypothetical protein